MKKLSIAFLGMSFVIIGLIFMWILKLEIFGTWVGGIGVGLSISTWFKWENI